MRSSGGYAGESGVLFMDMIAEIRRRHWVSKESISSIARDLKLSRPTVRKTLPDPIRTDLSTAQAANADAGGIPGDAGDLVTNRTRAFQSPAAHRASVVRGIAG